MSDEEERLTVRVAAETQAAETAIASLGAEMRGLAKAGEVADVSTKSLARSTAETTAKVVAAKEAVERSARAQREAASVALGFGADSLEAAEAQQRLQRAQEAATKATREAERALAGTAAAVQKAATTADEKSVPALKRMTAALEKSGKEAERTAGDLRKLDAQIAASNKADGDPFGRISAGLGKMSNLLAAGGLVAGVGMLATAMGEAAERALKFSSAESALSISVVRAQRDTGGLISKYNLMTAANSAVGLGVVKNEQEFSQLAEAATKLALKTGTDVTGAVGNLVTALGRGSTELLDNYGIVMKVADAQQIYAAAIGKSVADLSEEEKKNAFKVVALQKIREAADGANVSLETGVAKVARYNAEWENFKDTAATAAVSGFGAVTDAISGTTEALYKMSRAGVELSPVADQMARVRREAEIMRKEAEADDPVARHRAALESVKNWRNTAANENRYEETDRDKRIRERAAAEQQAWEDEQARAGMMYGPAAPPTKAKGGRKAKGPEMADPGDVARTRVLDGRFDQNLVSDLVDQRDQKWAEEAATAQEKASQRSIDALKREMEVRDAMGVVEEERVNFLAFSMGKKTEAQAQSDELLTDEQRQVRETMDVAETAQTQREALIGRRFAAEMKLAKFQLQNAKTDEQRERAQTAIEKLEHDKRLAIIRAHNEAEAKEQARKIAIFEGLSGAMQDLGGQMVAAIEAQAKGEKGAMAESVANFAKGIRDKMILKAIEETALGIGAAAGVLTIALAPAHFAAAAAYTAAAAAAGGVQAGFHAMAKNAGLGSEKSDSGGGSAPGAAGHHSTAGGYTPEPAANAAEQHTSGGTPMSDPASYSQEAPISHEQSRRADVAGMKRTGNVINITGNNFYGAGGVDDLVKAVRKGIDQSERGGARARN